MNAPLPRRADLRWLHREHLLVARRGQPSGFRSARANIAWHLERAAICRRELALPEERDLMILRIRAGVAALQAARTPTFPALAVAGGAQALGRPVSAGNPTPLQGRLTRFWRVSAPGGSGHQAAGRMNHHPARPDRSREPVPCLG